MLRFYLFFSIFLLFMAAANQISIASETSLNPTIKIISPTNGQNIQSGNLTIFGVSTDNPSLNCIVQIDINNVKPYQNATATGPDGMNDFSTWKYTTAKSHHMLDEGLNNITAKFFCDDSVLKTTKYTSITIHNANPQPTDEKIKAQVRSTLIENEVSINQTEEITPIKNTLIFTGKNLTSFENNKMVEDDLENTTNINAPFSNNISIESAIANITRFNSPIENMIKDVNSLIVQKQNNTIFNADNNVSQSNIGDELVSFVGNFATSVALFNPDILLSSPFLSSLINADAGNDIVVKEGKIFSVDGSRSSNTDGGITTYIWQQIDDSKIKIIPENSAFWSVRAPEVQFDTTLEFKLTVVGENGSVDWDTVNVTILDD
ncbi:MAG: hypothetical protein DA328_01890 [Nitrososphaeraceae archaeon]|nr:hypothetical protein [Nitrososphaeraceae archaeon]